MWPPLRFWRVDYRLRLSEVAEVAICIDLLLDSLWIVTPTFRPCGTKGGCSLECSDRIIGGRIVCDVKWLTLGVIRGYERLFHRGISRPILEIQDAATLPLTH